jgi:hypothetical protein
MNWRNLQCIIFHLWIAGKNISTVIPASRKRRRKGNPVVSGETVMNGYEPSSSLTTDRLHYKLHTLSLVRKGASKAIVLQKEGKSKIWSWAPKRCPTPRRISRLTVGHNINSTQNAAVPRVEEG